MFKHNTFLGEAERQKRNGGYRLEEIFGVNNPHMTMIQDHQFYSKGNMLLNGPYLSNFILEQKLLYYSNCCQ